MKKPNQNISPPAGTDGYARNSNCKWIIVAPIGKLIQLTFSSFDLEDYQDCRYDYLAIYDNIVKRENDSNAMGKYCGTASPPLILSSSRALSLFFKTDDSVNGNGFVASYTFIDGRNCKLMRCGDFFFRLF